MILIKKIKRFFFLLKTKGLIYTIRWTRFVIKIYWNRLRSFIIFPYYKFISKPKFFSFQNTVLHQFWHPYNPTWESERAIEIPITMDFVEKKSHKEILEIGTVLPNYFPSFKHDVLDKYDKVPGVINEDAETFHPLKKYDLIISISTLEHVGYNIEEPRDPCKIKKTIENLKEYCLTKEGLMIFTVPLGFNPHLDDSLDKNELGFTEVLYLKRTNSKNDWEEISKEGTKGAKYGCPFPFANVIAVAIYKNV